VTAAGRFTATVAGVVAQASEYVGVSAACCGTVVVVVVAPDVVVVVVLAVVDDVVFGRVVVVVAPDVVVVVELAVVEVVVFAVVVVVVPLLPPENEIFTVELAPDESPKEIVQEAPLLT
jgi:hypothetical protein